MLLSFDIKPAEFDFLCPQCRYEVHVGDVVVWFTPPTMATMLPYCPVCAHQILTQKVRESGRRPDAPR